MLQVGDPQLVREFDYVSYGCTLGEDGNEEAVMTVVVTDEANMKKSCGKLSSNKNDISYNVYIDNERRKKKDKCKPGGKGDQLRAICCYQGKVQ